MKNEPTNEPIDPAALQARLDYLLDHDLPANLPPDQRLLLAVLRQAVVDYFGADRLERLSAGLYFARSSVYRTTLQLFNLPEDTLPLGVDLSAFRKEEKMDDDFRPGALSLATLVRRLTGTQLKIVLTMGLLPQPVTTRQISLHGGLSRSTVLGAMEQLVRQELVRRHDDGLRPTWSLPEGVQRVLDEVWGAKGSV